MASFKYIVSLFLLLWVHTTICALCPVPRNRPNFEVVHDSASPLAHKVSDGKIFRVRCKPGFAASNKTVDLKITCQKNGTWTPAACDLLKCPPITLHHGHLVITTLDNYTRQAEAFCHRDYVSSGSKVRLCLGEGPEGHWSGEKARCEHEDKPPLCSKDGPPQPGPAFTYKGVFNFTNTHGVHTEGYPYGTKVIVSCKDKHLFTGSSVWVCGVAGQWEGTTGDCKPQEDIKCKLPALEPLHGRYNLSGIDTAHARYGQVVHIQCNPGYTLVGTGHITCQANETWTHHGHCIPTTTTTTSPTTTTTNPNNNNNNNRETGSTPNARQYIQQMNSRLPPEQETGARGRMGEHTNQRRIRRNRRMGHRQHKLRHPVHHGDPSLY